ncbi:MAG: DUF2905 domain-containing protein [Desulfonatronovibrionaceae bacterium]
MGRWLIIAGLVLATAGVVLHFAPWLVGWFGRLPGDIRLETERTKVFIPITSMLILSIVLSIVFNLFFRR